MTIVEDRHLGVSNSADLFTQYYQVVNYRCSESAFVFFAHNLNDKGKQVAIKVLRACDDTRYNLTNAEKRYQCQIDALRWNRLFTPEIEIGLCLVVEEGLETLTGQILSGKQPLIALGDPITDPNQVPLLAVPHTNYALVMDLLPQERRLDILLEDRDIQSVKYLLEILVKRVVQMHQLTPPLPHFDLDENGKRWGSYAQLTSKLQHNIYLFKHIALLGNAYRYEKYFWLEDALQHTIEHPRLSEFFEHRLKEGYIKRCHGDLKARNIWIEPSASYQTGAQIQDVRILDAIDFNQSYANIDVLSDIAMLAIDVQAIDRYIHGDFLRRHRSDELANFVIDTYFSLTRHYQQDNKGARTVLSYYLLEKAIVRAAVGLYFDRNDSPQLGKYFLDIARERMINLDEHLGSSILPTLKASTSRQSNVQLSSDTASPSSLLKAVCQIADWYKTPSPV